MSDEYEFGQFAAKLEELMRYTQSAEGLLNLLPIITLSLDQVTRIVERDPELGPEMGTVVDSLEAATAAARRAFDFASARLHVRLDLDEASD